ncbi:restriction endonuclease subunit S [Escherichia coli]|uniref:restriction endonuclease subunit S n=1 Tax=Escherichia coli TaxID=562 RepID=UPI0002A45781|nr:restriction endonuclease subunit S [Escherichia coli]EFJ1934610.1 restriction endonuclease subunit S [Escherichia coli]EFJ1937274.1 restriction endonuclease subunit S [Escherichia coli]EHK3781499.1 restriction endonuclease subunit S [Escherichia coli]EHK3784596.1 restriction endonuclease subunit S [Escherichia coli]EHK7385713.1 restriction endonuclease subunit S [Escherichia coli]
MIFNSSKYNSHWQDKKLSDLGSFRRGKSRHRPRNDPKLFKNGVYPLVQTGEVKQASLYLNNHHSCYNEFGLSQSEIWPENTLCITIAANIAETALLSYPMCFPDSIVGFNAYQEESSEIFMHYVFTYIRRAIQNSASGSIQDNINIDYLTGLKFKVPLKSYQDKIVSVLSVLDNKIDLNNRINAELEAMAKTLYDYWFVQFDFPDANGKPYKTSGGKMEYNATLKREIPAGWKSGTLDDLGQIVGGSTPTTSRPENFTTNGTPWITPNDLSDNQSNKFISRGAQDVSVEGIKSASLKTYPAGTVLLSSRAPIGYMAIARNELTTNQGFKSFIPSKNYSTEYVYYAVKNSLPVIMQNASGSTFKEVSGSVLKSIDVMLPAFSVVDDFTKTVAGIFSRQDKLEQENQQLTALRDWLLPLLMNGQVTVK